MRRSADVVVVGGGVAGLAAAERCRAAGLDVVLLEGRKRIGGRILTLRDARLATPVELGAEFVHGEARSIVEVARRARLPLVDVGGSMRERRGRGTDDGEETFEDASSVLGALSSSHAPERTLLEALASPAIRLRTSRVARERARRFVEGFHAADAGRIGEWSLAEGGPAHDEADAERAARVVTGYDRIPAGLAAGAEEAIVLGARVTDVEWEPGAVRVAGERDGRRFAVTARAAVLTVPLPLLGGDEPSGVQVDPMPAHWREATAVLALGSARRVVMAFERWPWQGRSAKGDLLPDDLSFLFGDDEHFPVFWTGYPGREPLVTAWVGGPRAASLAGRPDDEVIGLAVRALAATAGITVRAVERALLDAWTYDWDLDRWARGAYSYPLVGGKDAAKRLARPALGTLWYAGEASATGGAHATVHGAIAAGWKAASEAAKALGA